MKIYKISDNADLEKLTKQITPATPISEIEKIAQQAYQKNYMSIIGDIVRYPQFVNNLSISNLILKTMEKNGSLFPIEILRTFLSNLRHMDFTQIKAMDNETRKNLDKINNQIISICLHDSATISAAVLENTPPDLTNRIISRTGIWQKDRNLSNDPVLQQILLDLQHGQTWKNNPSAFMLLSRLMDNDLDKFITEAAKYDMLPPVAKIFQNAAQHHKNNQRLNKNITENKNPGIVIGNILQQDENGGSDPQATIISFLEVLSLKEGISPNSQQNYYANQIWNYIITKMQQNLEWAITAFSYEIKGDNIIRIFYYDLMENKQIFSQLLDIILKYKNQYNFSRTYVFDEIIENSLRDPTLQHKVLQLPEEYFQGELDEESKSILRNYYHPQLSEDAEEFMGLMSSKYEWMIKYANSKRLLKEAGYQNEIAAAMAVAMVILGIEIGDIMDSTHLSRNQIASLEQNRSLQEQIAKNTEFLNDVREYMKTQEKPFIMDESPEIQQPVQKTVPSPKDVQNIPSNVQESNLDKIVDLFIKHEGLLPRQTPFKITSPEMRKKDSIHGFAIDRTTPKPAGRQNFIFLKNPNDVHGAVKQQIIHYINNPSKYGLNEEPTLLDIIKKFDQTGAKNKVNFIIAEMPGLDINKPLSEMA